MSDEFVALRETWGMHPLPRPSGRGHGTNNIRALAQSKYQALYTADNLPKNDFG